MKQETPHPPKWARRFLRWFCSDQVLEFIEGDLYELYFTRLKKQGKVRANLHFILGVFSACRPFALHRPSIIPSSVFMFRNYLKMAWRGMARQWVFSGIKIGGFAAGIASCLLIGLFVHNELIYDEHYPDGNRLYRVVGTSTFNGRIEHTVFFPAPMISALKDDYPEIELAGHYNSGKNFGAGSNEVRWVGNKESIHEDAIVYADQGLLDVFQFPFVEGNPRTALSEPNTVVITKRMAEKYFHGQKALDKILIFNNDENRQYKVSGVIEVMPETSHLQVDFLLSLGSLEFWPGEGTSWGFNNYIDYVKVKPGTDIPRLEEKLSSLKEKYFMPVVMESGAEKEDIEWMNAFRFELQPVSEIYLSENDIYDDVKHGDIRYIRLSSAIAGFILLIACINFINLSTAKSANRAKEVGLRKTIGGHRFNLIQQFLTESFLISFLSITLGLVMSWIALPYFNALLAKSLVFPWLSWWLVPALLLAALMVGLVAGLYPAIYLSSFRPIQVLKGNLSRGSRSSMIRGVLVIVQFTISVVLIIGTLIVHQQMTYLLTKKVGFDKDQVLLIQGTHTLNDQIRSFKNELLNLSEIRYVSIGDFLPVSGAQRNGADMWIEDKKEFNGSVNCQQWHVDKDYIKTLGLKIVKGRNSSPELRSDSASILVNETLVRELGLADPIGARVSRGWGDYSASFTIVGVVEDFHFESLRKKIAPIALLPGQNNNTVAVKVNTENMPGLIAAISEVWETFSPHQSIRYTFLDQRYARMYDDVARITKLFTAFSALAILIACLGLYGLSAFMVEQREKEISIRKVLGASISIIFRLLTARFLKLVGISLLIAVPLGWYLMRSWLDGFAYRIEMGWMVFILAGVASVMIALLTISSESIKAALTNPADTLRSE